MLFPHSILFRHLPYQVTVNGISCPDIQGFHIYTNTHSLIHPSRPSALFCIDPFALKRPQKPKEVFSKAMSDQTKTHTKAKISAAPRRRSTTIQPSGAAPHSIPKRCPATMNVPLGQRTKVSRRQYNVQPAIDHLQSRVPAPVALFAEEVFISTCELIEEACRTATTVYKTAKTLCRLSVRAATVVAAVGGLTVAVGMWAYAVGKRLWSRVFG